MTWPNRFYVAAVICALAPLTAGLSLLLLWCLGDWDWLTKGGLLVILGGILSMLLGCLCLFVSALWSLGRTSLRRLAARAALALALLAAVLPLSYLIAKTVAHSPEKRARLLVANDGPTIEAFWISGACVTTSFGSFELGDYLQKKFAIKRDGKLEFKATRNGQPVSGVLAERITPGDAPDYELTFNPDGSWAVEDVRRR